MCYGVIIKRIPRIQPPVEITITQRVQWSPAHECKCQCWFPKALGNNEFDDLRIMNLWCRGSVACQPTTGTHSTFLSCALSVPFCDFLLRWFLWGLTAHANYITTTLSFLLFIYLLLFFWGGLVEEALSFLSNSLFNFLLFTFLPIYRVDC